MKRLIKQLTALLRSNKSGRRRHENTKQISEHMASATTCSSVPHYDWNGVCCNYNSSCDVSATLSPRNQAPAPLALPLRTQMDFTCTERPLLLHLVSSNADSGLYSDMEDELEESAVSSCYSGDEDGCVWDLEEFEEDAGFSPLLEEWLITASDLSLDKVLTASERETVYSGYWHGSVVVHARSSPDRQSTIAEVHTLSNIRHENIQLFLGVCPDMHSDGIAIVMDQLKGEPLSTLLHRQGHGFNFQSVTRIMGQIAQGMEYLHAKGITHPLLTTKCVSVHYRICISMLTPGAATGHVEPDELVYLPPEAMRTLYMEQGRLHRAKTSGHTFEANIFSFGTIVYEMVTMQRPFTGVHGNCIVWQVATGRTHSLQQLAEGKFRDLVQGCWTERPHQRPSFKELLEEIEQNMSPKSCGLKSHFSFSEPSQLAKLGL